MNWTEGKLARHSRARQGKQGKQGTLLRQKQHFAKARAGLLQTRSDHTPPALGLTFPSGSPQANDALFTAAVRVVADYPNTDRRWLSPPVQSLSAAYHCTEMDQGPRGLQLTSPRDVDEFAVREKRKKLLRETDWAGVRMQKPIPVHFEQGPSDTSRWTKRRRSSSSRIQHIVGKQQQQLRQVNRTAVRHYKDGNVQVTVGSQEVRFGEASSSHRLSRQPSRRRPRLTSRDAVVPTSFTASSTGFTQTRVERNIGGNAAPSHEGSHFTPPAYSYGKHHVQGDSAGSTPLKAPKPVRFLPKLNQSFEAFARHTDESIIAQVGQTLSPIPVSRREDNDVWRRFAGPSHSSADGSNPAIDELYPHAHISPGVSTRLPKQIPSAASLEERSPPTISNGESDWQDTPREDIHQVHTRWDHLTAFTRDSDAWRKPSNACSDSGRSPSLQRSNSGSEDIPRPSRIAASSLETPALPSPNASRHRHSRDHCTSQWTGSEADSIDNHVAGLREAALKLVSRRNGTPRMKEGKGSLDANRESPPSSRPNCVCSSQEQLHEACDPLPIYNASALDARAIAAEGRVGLGIHTEGPADGGHNVELPQPYPLLEPLEPSLEPPQGGESRSMGALRLESPDQFLPRDSPVRNGAAAEGLFRAATPVALPITETSLRQDKSSKGSDDIWFKYVFSDTDTQDLHKEVLDETARESRRKFRGQLDAKDLGRIPESDLGDRLSTAATQGLTSIDRADSAAADSLTSSYGVSASHRAATGSPITTTQAPGTTLDGWEGCGGPPYAAPSMQGLTSSGSTFPAQHANADSSDTGSRGRVPEGTSSPPPRTSALSKSVTSSDVANENFRFAPPTLFVGKLSEALSSERRATAVKPVNMLRPKRGRPKKKAHDGRASIRSIPAFHDDPIEDFEELREGRAGKQGRVGPSLFGALDTE